MAARGAREARTASVLRGFLSWEQGTPSRGHALSLSEGAPSPRPSSRQARRQEEEVLSAPRSVPTIPARAGGLPALDPPSRAGLLLRTRYPKQVSFESSLHDMDDDEIDNLLTELRQRALEVKRMPIEPLMLEAPKVTTNGPDQP